LAVSFAVCGDGVLDISEECEAPNTKFCDAQCKHIPQCGDQFTDVGESCDDGNTVSGDGCDSCVLEDVFFETEPNDDGNVSPSNGGEGNDFSIDTTNGVFTEDTTIVGDFALEGDEDVFQVRNSTSGPRGLRFTIKSLAAASKTPRLDVHDESGVQALSLSGFGSFVLAANERAFLHAMIADDTDIDIGSEAFYLLDIDFSECGNDQLEVGEECEPNGPTPCDDNCQRTSICGDSLIDNDETCDDGNLIGGDGCNDLCQFEGVDFIEHEPNEDGSTSPDTNDFSAENANGPFSQDTIIFGNINPAGDEDVFAVTNLDSSPVVVRFDTFRADLGLGVACPRFDFVNDTFFPNTDLFIRNSAGDFSAFSDERATQDSCGGLSVTIAPQETVFAHVVEFTDEKLLSYLLQIDFTACGNGDVEESVGEECELGGGDTATQQPCTIDCQRVQLCGDGFIDTPEQCDDGNTTSSDGCSGACQSEAVIFEHEPNEDGSPQPHINDFSIINAMGPFSNDVFIIASHNPTGDEDVFAIQNPNNTPAIINLSTIELNGTAFCGGFPDIFIRDANGVLLASSVDDFDTEACTIIVGFVLQPNQLVYAHVVADDDATTNVYNFKLDFTECGNGDIELGEDCESPGVGLCDLQCKRIKICGDGILDPPEICDDGNLANNDGCSSSCQLELCLAGETQLNFAGSGLPLTIPDQNSAGVTNIINVADNRSVKKVIVAIGSIVHTFDGDLSLSLIGPNNVARDLSSSNGSTQDNYTNTLFKDGCQSITAGVPPFTGCFAPEQSLSVFNNISANGAWKLKLVDSVVGDEGTLQSWSLTLCVQ
jgi:cysteine-rich repeat protein